MRRPPAVCHQRPRSIASGRGDEPGIDQREDDQDRPEYEQALSIDPGDLDHGQARDASHGLLMEPGEDREINRQIEERERLRPDVHPTAEHEQGREPRQDRRPDRPVLASGGHKQQDGQRGDRTLGQRESGDASALVNPADTDLEEPVQVDPGSALPP